MKLTPILESITSGTNFVGYHCSRNEIKTFNGTIESQYSEYVPDMLEGLYHSDKDELRNHFRTFNRENYGFEVDLDNLPEPHEEDYEKIMNEIITEISYKYRWIFVFEKHPLEAYGEYCYKVYFKETPHHIHDRHEILADIYLYKYDNPPILEPV